MRHIMKCRTPSLIIAYFPAQFLAGVVFDLVLILV
jgi:hypothetical protein